MVVPNLLRRGALVKEQDDGFHASTLKHATGQVEDGVQVALVEEQLAQGCRVTVAQEGVLNYDTRTATRFHHLDEVLHEHVGGLGRVDVEILFDLGALAAAEGRIGEDDVLAVFLLNLREVLSQGVAADDVRGLQAVENQVHGGDDIGQRLLLLAEEGVLLQGLGIAGALDALAHVGKGLAQEARRATGRVIDRLANFGVHDLDDGADEGTGRVVLAAVAPGIAHLGNLGLIEDGHLVLVLGALETELVDEVDDLAQVVARGNLVLQLGKNLTYLVFQRLGTGGRVLELAKRGEQLTVDKGRQVGTRHGIDRVGGAVGLLGGGPLTPAHVARQDGLVVLAGEQGLVLALTVEVIQVLEEKQPRGLLDVVQLGGASRLVAQDIVYGIES